MVYTQPAPNGYVELRGDSMTFEPGDIVRPKEGVELCPDTHEFFTGTKEGRVLDVDLRNNHVVLDVTGRDFGWPFDDDKKGWNVFTSEIELAHPGSRMICDILKEAWEERGNLAVLTVYKERTGRDI